MRRDIDFLNEAWEIIDTFQSENQVPTLELAAALEEKIYSLIDEFENDGYTLPESAIYEVEMEVTEYYVKAWKQEDQN